MYKTGAVNFNIPSGQSYESMAIGGFKGIQYSDNPLAVDSDSAADMLNVYLSDSGTLTTRPRIEYLGKTPSSWEKIINRINLTDEYVLYQVLVNDVAHLYVRINSSEPIEVNLNNRQISKSKISAFYKDDKIYVLDNDYYVIKSNEDKTQFSMYLVENDEDTYAPTTYTEGSKSVYGYNVLNEKYRKYYYWDNFQNLSEELNKSNLVDFENGYYKKYQFKTDSSTEQLTQSFEEEKTWSVVVYNSDGTITINRLKIGDDGESSIETKANICPGARALAISKNGKFLLYQKYDYDTDVFDSVHVYDIEKELDKDTTIRFPNVTSRKFAECLDYGCCINNTGTVFGLCANIADDPNTSDDYFVMFYENDVDDIMTASKKLIEFPIYKPNLKLYKNSTGDLVSFFSKRAAAIDPTKTNIIYTVSIISSESVMKPSLVAIEDSFAKDYSVASSTLNKYLKIDDANIYIFDSIFNNLTTLSNPTGDYDEYSVAVTTNGTVLLSTTSGIIQINGNESFPVFEFKYDESEMHFGNCQIHSNVFSGYDSANIEGKLGFIVWNRTDENEPKIKITYSRKNGSEKIDSSNNYFRFQNNYWFYGNSNRLWRTSLNNPTYIEEYNYIDVGNDDRITGINIISDNLLAVYKANSFYLISRNEISDDTYVYTCTETKGEVGNLPIGQTITTKYSELPLSIDDSGIFYISQLKNVTLSEHNTTSVSSLIDKKFLAEPNKESILTHNHRYWTYFIFPGDTAKVYVYDNRTNEWYYWELPEGNIISLWEENEVADNGDLFTVTKYMTSDGKMYALRTVDKVVRIDANNEDDFYSTYVDTFSDRTQEIEWFWESQILPLSYTRYSKSYPAISYRKQLTHTGFLFTDTDENEEYSLDYSFKVYRKALSSVPENSISGTLNRVRSILRKTYIPRINFLQIKLKNSDLDYIHQTNLPNTYNKLNLIQLKLKYKLMEETV